MEVFFLFFAFHPHSEVLMSVEKKNTQNDKKPIEEKGNRKRNTFLKKVAKKDTKTKK